MKYTATQMAKKLNISRSYLYYLKDVKAVEIEVGDGGKPIWSQAVYERLKGYLETHRLQHEEKEEDDQAPPQKVLKINNRRYLGNKYKLLPFIKKIVGEQCQNIHTVADVFAGTGAVASAFTDKKLITNDNMYSNYICHVAWFGGEAFSGEKIAGLIDGYNAMEVSEDNYMSDNFADTYFSSADCRKIGYIREDIERRYDRRELNGRERALLITSLLYAMDKIANTCGHYDAYRQGMVLEDRLKLLIPEPDEGLHDGNVCYNTDTNRLMHHIEADLVYIDPPYNSRQYCDAYHLLENVARWEKPKVFGVAKKMDRAGLKSEYCTQKAAAAFEELIEATRARYILLSYNNMAQKGNDRSNAKIDDEDIMRILKKKGTVKVFSENYRAFSAGKSDIQENQERLFLCICHDTERKVIPSALNYTGGKYKLLPQILPLFPQDVDCVVDLFCGGCNVGINVSCSRVHFNDSSEPLIGLLNTLKRIPKEEVFQWIHGAIRRYGLSMVSEKGYDYYQCPSSQGLGAYNRDGYNRLREDFNKKTERDQEYYLMLYLLIVYAFNNQLRFNQKGEFNLPVGKRDFNDRMQSKLEEFIDRIQSGDYTFTHGDFRDIDPDRYTRDSFFYADPPYLITCATYNEQDGWTEEDERALLAYLEELDRRGIRFALSNVLESKGKKNQILAQWIRDHKNFRAVSLTYSYSNSNYHARNREKRTREVLVVNYRKDKKDLTGEIGFKSYCWSVGTTSYRTDHFNVNIECQLKLLKEFWQLPQNQGKSWTGNGSLQADYYYFLREHGFMAGEAKRPDKDARQKTSGLRDIGLLDDERVLTEAGEALLRILQSGDFSSDNLLEIPRDSFIYLKQLLKTCNQVNGHAVRPFVVFLYVISRTGYLTDEEFTYLLPLCIDRAAMEKIIGRILDGRAEGRTDYKAVILSMLMDMDAYDRALQRLQQAETVTEELISEISMNRKSAKYTRPYYKIYHILKRMVFEREEDGSEAAAQLYDATMELTNTKVGGRWRKYFFGRRRKPAILREGMGALNPVSMLKAPDTETFNREFFELLHLIKAEATLSDYFDLNRRYFRITDTVLFEDSRVRLDILPKCYVDLIGEKLLDFAFEGTDLLEREVELEEIHPSLKIDVRRLYERLEAVIGKPVTSKSSANQVIRDERYGRFNRLIDERFDRDTLIRLLHHFEERNDGEIRRLVTDNADIPTIFEYILGVVWYVISGREGDVLEYMNLSLEADLLPRTHAGGGEADIVWEYEAREYPEHTLLIEATLADKTNQRRMEMEPVSRHLGDYRLANPDRNAYCIFITTSLNMNVISDFRARKTMEYYDQTGTKSINGMKILPVQTSELIGLLEREAVYSEIYQMLEKAYFSDEAPKEWYEKNIVKPIANYGRQ